MKTLAPRSSTRPSRPRSGSASTPARPTRCCAAPCRCPRAPARTCASRCSPTGDAAREAEEAGADVVGAEDLVDRGREAGSWTSTSPIATPDLMGQVGKLGRVLGPRGLMPNPKTGTVTTDVGKAVAEFKAGKVEYRTDRYGNVHVPLGKVELPGREPRPRTTPRCSTRSCGPSRRRRRAVPQGHRTCVDDGPGREDRPRGPRSTGVARWVTADRPGPKPTRTAGLCAGRSAGRSGIRVTTERCASSSGSCAIVRP